MKKGLAILPFWAALLAALFGCGSEEERFQGYVEGEFVYLGSSQSGHLAEVKVARGEEVAAGQLLFVLEDAYEQAMVRQAEQEVSAAGSTLANLRRAMRAPEVEALEAQLAQARALLAYSNLQLARNRALYQSRAVAKADLDQAETAARADRAKVRQLESQLAGAKLPVGREEQIEAQKARTAAARDALAQARWRLEQKTVRAPRAGLIFDVFYREGEWLPAGAPVVSLLGPERIKIRFYVPETALSLLRAGQKVAITCDGCPPGLVGKINFISPEAEYTPPVIYSNERRSKLVYLIEARPRPEDGFSFHPGQPVEVQLYDRPGL